MDRKTIIGLIGSGLLAAGVFMPVLSVPIVGSVNYFRNGQGDGVIALALAGASFILTLTKNHKWLMLTGIFSLGLLSYTLYNLNSALGLAKTKLASDASGGLFGGIAALAAESVQLEWGWAVMFAGAVLLIVTSLMPDQASETSDDLGDVEESDRQPCLYCAEAIKIEATICRFCGREQPTGALPELINCPTCNVELTLDRNERLAKDFVCAECGYQTGQTYKDLIAS